MANWSNKRRHHQLLPRFSPTAVFTDTSTPQPTDPVVVTLPLPLPGKGHHTPPGVLPPLPPPETTSTTSTDPPPPTTTFTSTTSSSSTPEPTTTSSSSIVVVPTTTDLPLPMMPSTSVVVQTFPSLTATASAAASTSAAPSGGLSTGAVIGSVAGGLVAIGFAVFVCLWFLRRWKKQQAEEEAFNATAFRQSAILMDDDSTGYGSTGYGGRNPRPPTMIERKMANAPPSMPGYGAAQNGNQHEYYDYQQDYGQQQDPSQPQYPNYPALPPAAHAAHDIGRSFSPGQIVPISPTSPHTNPFQTPISSNYDDHNLPNDLLARVPSAVLPRQDSPADYIDMSRSSVTPYQAVQYAEINRRLQPGTSEDQRTSSGSTIMPSAHDFPSVPETIHQTPPLSRPSLSRNQASPFADPEDRHNRSIELNIEPPSPSYSRITSTPPSLPEITPTQKTFSTISPISYDFPVSAGPSPFTNSFSLATGDSNAAMGPRMIQPEEPAVHAAPKETTGKKAESKSRRPDTVYTEYGAEEDAYGGI